jgi:hypothetical protein
LAQINSTTSTPSDAMIMAKAFCVSLVMSNDAHFEMEQAARPRFSAAAFIDSAAVRKRGGPKERLFPNCRPFIAAVKSPNSLYFCLERLESLLF